MNTTFISSKIKAPIWSAIFIFGLLPTLVAQQDVFWRSEAANGNWENGGCGEMGTGNSQWWYQGFWPNNARNRPDCFDGTTTRHNLQIGNNHQTTMTVNTNFWGIRALTIGESATASRTFNSSPDDNSRGIGLSSGIYNHTNNNATHTFNVRLGIDASEVYLLTDFANNNTVYNREIFGNSNAVIFQGAGNTTVNGVISGSGARIQKEGSGLLTLNGNNTYSGSTRINAGTLQLGAAERINNASNLVLAGGTFRSGASTGFTETMGTIEVLENSTIDLGTGNHSLNFAASNSVSWTAGRTLTINGWTGTPGQSGTGGKVFFGNDANGLSSAQLAQISFGNAFVGATILSSGEIVPLGGLPVTLTSFQTTCEANTVHLSWTTASELNASHYEVEMSRDGLTWNNIGQVEAAGTTNQTTNYTFSTPNPSYLSYFRLIQLDFDGTSQVYGPISSLCSFNEEPIVVYPNPASNFFKVEIQSTKAIENVTVQISDITGRVVFEQYTSLIAGKNELPMHADLQSGTYTIRFMNKNQLLESFRFVKR